jgi:type I restriction enzyme M protein
MLLRTLESDPGRDLSKGIKLGSTLSNNQFSNDRFHYGVSNPPFGKKWEKDAKVVIAEHTEKGYRGRFGPGLPRINDGSMLFLLHLTSKLELPENGGGRAAIVLSGSPLFNGSAGSGESEIRRWLLEQDLVDAIVALPTEIFFRTGIASYLWILSNKKPESRQGKVQLINAVNLWTSIKNEGNKRRVISDDHIRQIVDVYASAEDCEISRMLDYRRFAYRRIRVLRPLRMSLHINTETMAKLSEEKAWDKLTSDQRALCERALKQYMDTVQPFAWAESFTDKMSKKDTGIGKVRKTFVKALINAFGIRDPEGEPVRDIDGSVMPYTDLTDYENVPYLEDVRDYFAKEVLPYVPDAWIDESYIDKKDKAVGVVGYEINFNRFFYKYEVPPKLEDIDKELKRVEGEIAELLGQVTQ